MAVNTKEPDFMTKLMIFLERYWLVIGGVILAYPMIKRYIDKQNELNDEAEKQNTLDAKTQDAKIVKETRYINNLNPADQQSRRKKITGSSELWAISTKLANDFGVNYSDDNNWYDFMNPRGLTENDAEICTTLIRYRNYFDKIEKLYFEVDTNSRNLRKDILKYLDAKELKRLRYSIKI